jgi:hypothetical protein
MTTHPDFRGAPCTMCGKPCRPEPDSAGTGYALDRDGAPVCYACCALRDREDMVKTGRACLYLTWGTVDNARLGRVTNWPATLEFETGYIRKGRHNFACVRYDFEFYGPDKPGGALRSLWRGTVYGDNAQIAHCRRVGAK